MEQYTRGGLEHKLLTCLIVCFFWQLIVVGPHSIPRLPVFSFLVRHQDSGRYLHHNFVCAVLNDVFGLQARGGCSCAGPYSQVRGVVGGVVYTVHLAIEAAGY